VNSVLLVQVNKQDVVIENEDQDEEPDDNNEYLIAAFGNNSVDDRADQGSEASAAVGGAESGVAIQLSIIQGLKFDSNYNISIRQALQVSRLCSKT
jgi:hypothetical protein